MRIEFEIFSLGRILLSQRDAWRPIGIPARIANMSKILPVRADMFNGSELIDRCHK